VRAGTGTITGQRQEPYERDFLFLLCIGEMDTDQDKANQQKNSLHAWHPVI
jgi:hypothetical protein